ncbi:MAG: hypothetical protein IPL28_22830 [Chloroflexi bacterium]|nr:hypothetical protein [Chloroflexota bacterium]
MAIASPSFLQIASPTIGDSGLGEVVFHFGQPMDRESTTAALSQPADYYQREPIFWPIP